MDEIDKKQLVERVKASSAKGDAQRAAAQEHAAARKRAVEEAKSPLERRIDEIATIKDAATRDVEISKLVKETEGLTKAAAKESVASAIRGRIKLLGAPEGSADAELVRDKNGTPVWCQQNVIITLTFNSEWKERIAFNEFTGEIDINGSTGTTGAFGNMAIDWRPLKETDATNITAWFNTHGYPEAAESLVKKGMAVVADGNVRNPVKEYLEGLEWDGEERIEKLFTKYFGAEASPYYEAIGAAFMISAVARAVSRNGAKVDTMPVLEGGQGEFKSTAIEKLFGEATFGDNLPPIGEKEASQYLRGKWCVEMAELENLRKKEWSTIKQFLSRKVEDYRRPYASLFVKEPRRNVFMGTTNEYKYVTDPTGARRLWPVRVGRLDIKAIEADRDQLWAEAHHRFSKKERWWLSKDEEALAEVVRDDRKPVDAWFDVIRKSTEKKLAHGETEIFNEEIYGDDCLGIPVERRGRLSGDRIGPIMAQLGWRQGGSKKKGRKWQHETHQETMF